MSFLNTTPHASQFLRERPSPHKLAVCVLVKMFVENQFDNDDSVDDEGGEDRAMPLTPEELSRFASFLQREVFATERGDEKSLLHLQEHIRRDHAEHVHGVGGDAGRQLSSSLRNILEEACSSPDALSDLISSLDSVLIKEPGTANNVVAGAAPPAIGRTSPLGLFMRQFLLALQVHFPRMCDIFVLLFRKMTASARSLS
jgi:hypothetical protein